MFFVGSYPLTIDSKSRLSIPFVVRDKMTREADGKAIYVCPGRQRGTLSLYPNEYFERTRLHDFPSHQASEQAYSWEQFEYSQSALLEPDSQGRVTVPERLLSRAGLDREVVLIGVRDHLELWSRQAYEEFEERQWRECFDEQTRTKAVAELDGLGAYANSRTKAAPAAAEAAAE